MKIVIKLDKDEVYKIVAGYVLRQFPDASVIEARYKLRSWDKEAAWEYIELTMETLEQ